jgi:hypothetical protein
MSPLLIDCRLKRHASGVSALLFSKRARNAFSFWKPLPDREIHP